MIYGLLRTKAIELGVWESRGKLCPEWDPMPIAIVGTTPKVNQLESWTYPDVVVYEPLGEEVSEDQPLSDRKLFCAIELKLSFPNPSPKAVNFEAMFRDDLKKLELLVREARTSYGISLNFIGWPPSKDTPEGTHSYMKNAEEPRVKVICVLAGDENPMTSPGSLW